MQAARYNFHHVRRLDLKRHVALLSCNDASRALHPLAEWRRCEMSQLNFSADRPLVSIEPRREQFASRALKLADQNWRAEHRRHAISRKIDDVLLLDHKFQFMARADSGK